MIKVAQILVGQAWSGGQNQTFQLLKHQPKGFENILITEPGSILGKKAEEIGIKTYYLKPKSHIDISYIKKVKKILIDENIDIVNVHRSTVHTNILVLKMFFYKKFKLIITRRINIPQNIFSRIKYNNKFIDHYIAVSNEVKKTLIKDGITENKITVIHSGVDAEKFGPHIKSNFRKKHNIPEDVEVFTCVANFVSYKGLEYLLEAISLGKKDFENNVFVFAGKNTDSEEFKNLVRKLGIEENTLLLGYREDVPEILKETDIFILPSLFEGFSGVIREALLMEKPVLTTRIPENMELVKDGINGFLFEPKNADAILNTILKIKNNKILQEQLGKKGREIVLKNYTIKITVEKTYQLYSLFFWRKI